MEMYIVSMFIFIQIKLLFMWKVLTHFKTKATGNSDMACYYINSYVDETVQCNHIHIRSVERNFHVVPFTMLPMVVLILNSNEECHHLNDKIWALQGGFDFEVFFPMTIQGTEPKFLVEKKMWSDYF